MGELWLDHELRVRALPERDRFFRATETVDKSSAAVLRGLLREGTGLSRLPQSLRYAAERNPQLEQQLRPLLVSPDIVGSVICVWSGDWPHKQDLLAALAELHQSVQGRQILAVFRTGRLAPYDPIAFHGVRLVDAAEAGAHEAGMQLDRRQRRGRLGLGGTRPARPRASAATGAIFVVV